MAGTAGTPRSRRSSSGGRGAKLGQSSADGLVAVEDRRRPTPAHCPPSPNSSRGGMSHHQPRVSFLLLSTSFSPPPLPSFRSLSCKYILTVFLSFFHAHRLPPFPRSALCKIGRAANSPATPLPPRSISVIESQIAFSPHTRQTALPRQAATPAPESSRSSPR